MRKFIPLFMLSVLLAAGTAAARPQVCSELDRAFDPDEPAIGKSLESDWQIPASVSPYARFFYTSLKLPGAESCVLARKANFDLSQVFCEMRRVECGQADRWLDIFGVTLGLCYPNADITYRWGDNEHGGTDYKIWLSLKPGAELPTIKVERYCATDGEAMVTYTIDYKRTSVDIGFVPPPRF